MFTASRVLKNGNTGITHYAAVDARNNALVGNTLCNKAGNYYPVTDIDIMVTCKSCLKIAGELGKRTEEHAEIEIGDVNLEIIKALRAADGQMFSMDKIKEAKKYGKRLQIKLWRKEFAEKALSSFDQMANYRKEGNLLEGLSNATGRDLDSFLEFSDIMFNLFIDYKPEMDQLRLIFSRVVRRKT